MVVDSMNNMEKGGNKQIGNLILEN